MIEGREEGREGGSDGGRKEGGRGKGEGEVEDGGRGMGRSGQYSERLIWQG